MAKKLLRRDISSPLVKDRTTESSGNRGAFYGEKYVDRAMISLAVGAVFVGLGILYRSLIDVAIGAIFWIIAGGHFLYGRHLSSKAEHSEEPARWIEGTSKVLLGSMPFLGGSSKRKRMARILKMIAVDLAIIGAFTTAGAFLMSDSTQTYTQSIPSGYYSTFCTTSHISTGHMSGNYSASPGDVTFYVFTSSQFNQYESTGSADCLYSHYGPSATFSLDLPGTGTYYLVAEHSADQASQSTDENLILTSSLSGIAITYLIPGIVLLAGAVALAIIGIMMTRTKNKS